MKKEIAFVNGKIIPTLAISIGTSYKVNQLNNKIQLVNVIYIPKIRKVAYNSNVHMQSNIRDMLNELIYSIDNINFLENDMGIYYLNKWKNLFNDDFIDVDYILDLDNDKIRNKLEKGQKIRNYIKIK